MYPEFKFSRESLQRMICATFVVVLLAFSLSFLRIMNTSAAELSSRYIKISDSSSSNGSIPAGVGSGTNVTYNVQFTSSSANISNIVIDFCDNSPVVGYSCTAPSNFTVTGISANSTSFTVNNTTGSANNTFKAAISGYSAGSNNITISGVTNPSSTGTYYARILLFTAGNIGSYTNAGTPGSYSDYGGVALSTTAAIAITAKVQETLSFCVTSASHSSWTTTNDCGDPNVAANLPALTLGHGSPSKILDSSAVDTGFIYTQISTNAYYGSTIRLRGANTCSGLSNDGGTSCPIPGIGNAAQMTAGTANFGLFVGNSVPGPGGVGSVTADSNYNDGVNTNTGTPTLLSFGMDSTNVPSTSAYGDIIAASSGPVYRANITNVFAATAALTNPAGIYTNNLSMIATGTF